MSTRVPNSEVWDGSPGHYEVRYLTFTDPASGTGVWIRLTMRAPSDGGTPEFFVWFLAMTPGGEVFARKTTHASAVAGGDTLRYGDAELGDTWTRGSVPDASWDLSWTPRLPMAEPVHPLLARARIAKTVFTVPHPDVLVSGTLAFGGRTLQVDAAKGGQAHLWGSKHAQRWAWTHCNDFDGVDDTFWEGVSVFVPRFGRTIGPSTPIVARVRGEAFASIGPVAIVRNASAFDLTSWTCTATDARRRLVAEITAPRETLVGVTYTDPDGEKAYCYNSEVASMTLHVEDRAGRAWRRRETLVSSGRTHFEYAQRTPVEGAELHLT